MSFQLFSHRGEVEDAVCRVGKLAFGSGQILNSGGLEPAEVAEKSPESVVYMGGLASRGRWGL